MGKKKGNKKAKGSKQELTPATEAYAAMDALKRNVGEHEITTPTCTITANSKEMVSPLTKKKEVRGLLKINGKSIAKDALRHLLDKVGRANGEEPSTNKVRVNNAYKKWAAKNADLVIELLGEDAVEQATPFSKDQLKSIIKKKALKKALKKNSSIVDEDAAEGILGTLAKKFTLSDALVAFGDTPSDDLKVVFANLI